MKAALALSVCLLGGCVSIGTFERQAARARQNEAARLEAEAELAEWRRKAAEIEALAEADAARFEEKLAERDTTIADARAIYDNLLTAFKDDIAAGRMELEIDGNDLRLVLGSRFLFPSGRAALDRDGQQLLRKLAPVLRDVPGHRFEIEGHTDDQPIGPGLARMYPTNWDLGAARAAAVLRALEEAGVPGGRLVLVSYGPMRPVADNETEAGRMLNRRVQVTVVPENPSPGR